MWTWPGNSAYTINIVISLMKNGAFQPVKMSTVFQALLYMDRVTAHHINCAENMIQNTNKLLLSSINVIIWGQYVSLFLINVVHTSTKFIQACKSVRGITQWRMEYRAHRVHILKTAIHTHTHLNPLSSTSSNSEFVTICTPKFGSHSMHYGNIKHYDQEEIITPKYI